MPDDGRTQPTEDEAMKDTRDSHAHFPVRDYSLAVQSAVSWLGDRYLLATPVHAQVHDLGGHRRPAGRASRASIRFSGRREYRD
jgi:hypothetical protein